MVACTPLSPSWQPASFSILQVYDGPKLTSAVPIDSPYAAHGVFSMSRLRAVLLGCVWLCALQHLDASCCRLNKPQIVLPVVHGCERRRLNCLKGICFSRRSKEATLQPPGQKRLLWLTHRVDLPRHTEDSAHGSACNPALIEAHCA